MASAQTSKGLVNLLKRGWNEIPEIVGSSFMALIGVGLGFTGLYIYSQKDGDNRKHKYDYIVIRPDDPRAQTMKKY